MFMKKGTLLDAAIIEAASRQPRGAGGAGARGFLYAPERQQFLRIPPACGRGRGFCSGAQCHPEPRACECDRRGGRADLPATRRPAMPTRPYESKIRSKGLKAHSIMDRIMHTSHKYQKPLSR